MESPTLGCRRTDRLGLCATLPATRTVAVGCRVGEVQIGRVDHPQYGPPALNERDIHCEFAITLDKLLGAVERVDEPEASSRYAGWRRGPLQTPH